MKKFEGLLFCTDLDGTLYTSDKTVSKQNLDAIEYFKSEGGLFTFITGRVPKTAEDICAVIKPNAPYGCINGGGIYDFAADRYLWTKTLPREALDLVRVVDMQMPDMGIQLNTEKEVYFNKDNSAMEYFREVTGLPNVACHYEDVIDPILKVVFGHADVARIEALADLLSDQPSATDFDFIRSERNLYEILPKGASKGDLLGKMAELFGIDPHKTIAVGDYNNDVSMLRQAGVSFAVENAVPEVKAAADHITVSNDEHAIAAIIDGLDRGIYSL